MKDPAKVAAGRKGGIAPHKGKRGFAANHDKAKEAGRKGAISGWKKRSQLEKFKLHYELTPGDPKYTTIKKTTKAKK